MKIYTLQNNKNQELIRFVFSAGNELVLAAKEPEMLEVVKRDLEENFANGVMARRGGREIENNQEIWTTYFTPIDKEDPFYPEAVIEHMERIGYKVEVVDAPKAVEKIAAKLAKAKLAKNLKNELLTKALFADEKQVKELQSILDE